MYYEGKQIRKNVKRAKKLWLKAAQKRIPAAQGNLEKLGIFGVGSEEYIPKGYTVI
jgi:TPR repeat protein